MKVYFYYVLLVLLCHIIIDRFSRPDNETERYIEKITDNEERYELFRSVKQWKRATEVATKLKDPYKLQEVIMILIYILVTEFRILYLNRSLGIALTLPWRDKFKIF